MYDVFLAYSDFFFLRQWFIVDHELNISHGQVLDHLLYIMRVGEKNVQRRVALALAHLCSPDDQKTIFIDKDGLPLLLELLASTNSIHQRDSSMALCRLANKASSLIPMDAAPLSPTPQVTGCSLYGCCSRSSLCPPYFISCLQSFWWCLFWGLSDL